jgi:hypothetical protein
MEEGDLPLHHRSLKPLLKVGKGWVKVWEWVVARIAKHFHNLRVRCWPSVMHGVIGVVTGFVVVEYNRQSVLAFSVMELVARGGYIR